ncbi:MAG: hypothetical protein EBY61_10785 [Actinobacteria bacterium]|nr:hypothetical protein [Actinomycetota bacterium]
MPTGQVGQLLQRVLFNIEAPTCLLAGKAGNTTDDQPIIGTRSVENDGHQRTPLRTVRVIR